MKDQAYVGLAYMTGILPIKKYGTHSALNMFGEYDLSYRSLDNESIDFPNLKKRAIRLTGIPESSG